MSSLTFHKCYICHCIFYSYKKDRYCPNCVPKFKIANDKTRAIYHAINNRDEIEKRKARERERWHKRMENPKFREHERLRSLARARAERKYRKESEE